MPRIVRYPAGLALVSLVLSLDACGPKPVVFTPTACQAEPCGAPVILIGDFTNKPPEYPQIMRSVGIDGRVEVEFVVTPGGTVDRASVVVRSSTNRSFERNTIRAVEKWQFATRDGSGPPMPTRYAVRVDYRLNPRRATTGGRADPGGPGWAMIDSHPVLTVTSAQNVLIPRDQIRPLGRPNQ
jgi:TonB family protein